jgi:cobalt-zinc-cadmium efflux system outer membrane protein
LESLVNLALANNPALQQALAVAAKAGGVRTQVGLRPNFSLGYLGQEIGNGGSGGQHGAFYSQTFVRGRKLALNRQVIGHDVNSVRWQVQVQRQRVETDVRIRFYRVLAAQQRLEEAELFRQEAFRAVGIFEARLRAAEAARPDLLQSQILVDQVDLTIRAVELEWRAAWQELAAIAGLPGLMEVRLSERLETEYPELSFEALANQIAARSPLLKSALARVDRTRANLQRQRRQPVPNIQTQAAVARDDDTGDDFASLQVSVPIPIRNRNQGNIRAAFAEYCEATQNAQRIRMQIRLDLADALRRYETARARVEKYQTSILPKAQESLELIRQAQDVGEVEFLRVLSARQSFFEYNQLYLAELGQLAQNRAEIDGLLLTGGLASVVTYDANVGLRGQALSGQ